MLSFLPNILTFCRLPLALLFLFTSSVPARFLLIFLAGVSDGLDGFLARRFNWKSPLGTVLDPIMDKLFVGILLWAFWIDGQVGVWEIVALLSRDLAVVLFGCYLYGTQQLANYEIRAIWCGKVMTCLQFFAFAVLVVGYTLPAAVYLLFLGIGVLSLFELVFRSAYLSPRNNS